VAVENSLPTNPQKSDRVKMPYKLNISGFWEREVSAIAEHHGAMGD
jgi:hypothetical protein